MVCERGSNDLVISGPPTLLARIRSVLASDRGPVDFDRLLAPSVELTGAQLRAWRLGNWGTSTNAGAVEMHDRDAGTEALFYSFTTPGRAPIAVLSLLAARHPQLEITLHYERDPLRSGGRGYRWSAGHLSREVDFDHLRARERRCGERDELHPVLVLHPAPGRPNQPREPRARRGQRTGPCRTLAVRRQHRDRPPRTRPAPAANAVRIGELHRHRGRNGRR